MHGETVKIVSKYLMRIFLHSLIFPPQYSSYRVLYKGYIGPLSLHVRPLWLVCVCVHACVRMWKREFPRGPLWSAHWDRRHISSSNIQPWYSRITLLSVRCERKLKKQLSLED